MSENNFEPLRAAFILSAGLVEANSTGRFESPIYGIGKLYIVCYNIYNIRNKKEVNKMTDREMLNTILSYTDYHIYVNDKRYMEIETNGYENLSFEFDGEGNLKKIY